LGAGVGFAPSEATSDTNDLQVMNLSVVGEPSDDLALETRSVNSISRGAARHLAVFMRGNRLDRARIAAFSRCVTCVNAFLFGHKTLRNMRHN
jgi:hypothetical protein